jgi:serine/threonine protein kinase
MLFGSRKYKYEVDIWSLGCILVELATGQQLFAGKSELEQIALISNFLGDPSPKNWPSIVTLQDYGKINFVERVPKTK